MRTLSSMALAGFLLLTSPAYSQTLEKVRIDDPNPEALKVLLENAGYDVLESDHQVELIVNAFERNELKSLGYPSVLLEKGRPMRDILAEQSLQDGVPSGYQDLAQINTELAATAAAHPNICRVVDLSAEFGAPLTFEGRSILALKISDNPTVDEDEPSVLFASAHHCRELVTPVIALTAIEHLTDGYGNVPAITQAVNEQEIWIIPVVNVDGYEYVFNGDNFWRKNRRVVPGGIGIDLNRNYGYGWTNSCSGSTNPNNNTYKGPSPFSEAESLAILALAEDRRFAKVVDYHSSGREVLWSYACPTHPFDTFHRNEAIAISQAAGYGGSERAPSADGEHQQWHQGKQGAWAVLIETHTSFQPSYTSAQSEATQMLGGVDWILDREIAASGHVTDLCSGQPLDARVSLVGVTMPPEERNASGGPHGRWNFNLPPGNYTLEFEAAGHQILQAPLTVVAGVPTTLDVQLSGNLVEDYCIAANNSTGQIGRLNINGSTSIAANDFTVEAVQLPAGEFCLFVYGQGETQQPLFDGFLCFNSLIIRQAVTQSDSFGFTQTTLDLANPVYPLGQILAGTTWNFQTFYRDTGFGANAANLTLAKRVTFCP